MNIRDIEYMIEQRDESLFAIHKVLDANIISCTACYSRFFKPKSTDIPFLRWGFCSSTCQGRYDAEHADQNRVDLHERGFFHV